MSGARASLAHVAKRYGAVVALDDVTLAIIPGERLALIGHNGAGKTTLIRLILGLATPDAGEIEVLGGPPGAPAGRRALAYLPENVAFHGLLTGREQLALYAALRREPARVVTGLIERVGLADAMDRRIATYSKGMRQRLGLAQLLLGRPRLVLLDEPTSGLDPLSREAFHDVVSELARAGAGVLMSSHALTEIEARTDRIAILANGRVVADGRLPALRAEARLPIRLRVEARADCAGTLADQLGGARVNGCSVEIMCAPEAKLSLLGTITALGPAVRDIEIVLPSLEDVFRHFSGENPRRDTP
jgi:Cu-processing system ATP-binding protein